ncbi:unnamed protein product [Arctogadus glacialis]
MPPYGPLRGAFPRAGANGSPFTPPPFRSGPTPAIARALGPHHPGVVPWPRGSPPEPAYPRPWGLPRGLPGGCSPLAANDVRADAPRAAGVCFAVQPRTRRWFNAALWRPLLWEESGCSPRVSPGHRPPLRGAGRPPVIAPPWRGSAPGARPLPRSLPPRAPPFMPPASCGASPALTTALQKRWAGPGWAWSREARGGRIDRGSGGCEQPCPGPLLERGTRGGMDGCARKAPRSLSSRLQKDS